jgi:1,4-alpha-glucan branching enzyme
MALDPLARQYHHHNLTFSFHYAFSENFVLPVSHDEVVHGKSPLINKIKGDMTQKFAGVRAFLGYMIAHPGKKLLFMGCEFGQTNEWNYKRALDWDLLKYESHRQLKDYVAVLNRFYLENSPLWQIDYSWEGFSWISSDDSTQNIIAFRRIDKAGRELIVLCNFAPVVRTNYRIGVPKAGVYQEIFNSDDTEFGGQGYTNLRQIQSEPKPFHGQKQSILLTVPPMSTVFFQFKDTGV